MNDFRDKVVLVTGAGKGLGRAIAQAFAARGANVAANDITPVNLDETLLGISAKGVLAEDAHASDYVYDVAKRLPVRSLVDQVVADWGRIDVLVNSARVEPRAALLDMDEWDWHRTLDVNLSGPFYTMQAVGRAMLLHGNGVMVNIIDARRGQELQGYAAYLASKTGLIGLTRVAAHELAAHGIRVRGLCLDESDAALSVCPDEIFVALRGSRTEPADVAEAVLRLCSDVERLT